MSRAVLSLGSNLGDRRRHLERAVATLRDWPAPGGDRAHPTDLGELTAVSSIYRTPPWGPVPQDDFFNITLIAQAPWLDPYGWLDRCRLLEREAGRVRDIRWGPRTLDVDIVTIDDVVSVDPDLTLPHPRAHDRAFVLLPWAEIEPDAVLPGYGPILDLLATLSSADISLVGHVS